MSNQDTLMPTHITSPFSVEELAHAAVVSLFDFHQRHSVAEDTGDGQLAELMAENEAHDELYVRFGLDDALRWLGGWADHPDRTRSAS